MRPIKIGNTSTSGERRQGKAVVWAAGAGAGTGMGAGAVVEASPWSVNPLPPHTHSQRESRA